MNKRTITIEVEYGSEWQKESDPLWVMLSAYVAHFSAKHKKNKVKITPSTNE